LGVAIAVALQQHQFVHPSFVLVLLLVAIAPRVLDLLEWPPILCRYRFHPVTFVVSAVTVLGVVSWLCAAYGTSYDYSPFIIVLLIGEMAATAGPRFGAVVGLGAMVDLIIIINIEHFTGMVVWGFAFVIAWLGGTAFRHQVLVAYELTQAQTELAQRAAEDERHRLARDVHDLIAHSLAVTMLQISGARLALQAGESDEAMAALQDAEAAGRAAMSEIHRTVGLLGSGGKEASAPPTPSAADLPNLVDSFRSAGLSLDVVTTGEFVTVPLAVGLATYRVVQESLSNAVKHAPGSPVRLQVDVLKETIAIEITNPIVPGAVASDGGGNGLRGMAERAELLGGSVIAHNGDGTWKVRATIPWESVTA
jgi:signal transduction histidine kinase